MRIPNTTGRWRLLLFTVFLACLGFSSGLFAQDTLQKPAGLGGIDGKLFDSIAKTPLEYATVSLFNATDSTVVAGVVTDENGYFELLNLPLGKFYLRFTYFGLRDKYVPNVILTADKPLRKIGNVSMSDGSAKGETQLDDFVVTAKREMLQTGIEKKVYDVTADISVQGGTANDALNNVPSVELDQDGNLSLRGDQNVTVLIDGRPSSFSGSNGKSLLDGIPASSIERIEIVTNPSAKYDPDGTSGIINIVLKKNVKQGINGQVNLSAATGNAYNGALTLSSRNTKYNIYGSYSYGYRAAYRNNNADQRQNYTDSTVYFTQRRKGQDTTQSHTAKIGMDLYLKDRNTLSWSLSGNTSDRIRDGQQQNFRYLTETDTLAQWERDAQEPTQNHNLDASLNYQWDFKEDKGNVLWGAYQSVGQNKSQGYYQSLFSYPADTTNAYSRLFSTEKNAITTLTMDVVRLFNKKWRTESGLKAIIRNQSVNTYSESRDLAGTYNADTLANYDYQYSEQIYSAYGILASSWKKFSYQVGLRAEQAYQVPNLVSKGEKFTKDYFNLFPSVHVRYTASKVVEWSLGYSKRINRASADNLNPFTSYADPYNLRRGNPSLGPEYIHSIDLGLTISGKKISVTAAAYERFSTDVIQRVKVFYAQGYSASTYANVATSMATGGELVVQYKPVSIWRNTLSMNGNYIQYSDDNTTVNYNRSGFVFAGKLSSTVDLMNKTLSLQVNARYSAPSVTAAGTMQRKGGFDFSADKSFKDGKWGVGFRITDIFNTMSFTMMVDQPQAYQFSTMKPLTRRAYISVRYRFGRTDTGDRKKQQQDADPSGQNGGGFDF